MRKLNLPAIFLLSFFSTTELFSQSVHIGITGGAASYIGDLSDNMVPQRRQLKGTAGMTLNYELYDQLMIRSGITYAHLAGADSWNTDPLLKSRNLSFQTDIIEISLMGELYLLNLNYVRLSPYLFGGIALFHFNPYAFSASGQKVYLQPLGTEGQGIPGYNNPPYKLTQPAFPFGGGMKYALNDQLRIGLELGVRKLFTDYLDDLSTKYADPADLLNAKGALAVKMAYREDELAGGNPVYPAKGTIRGGDKVKDYYYTFGVHVTYKLRRELGGGVVFNGTRKNTRLGCPLICY